MTSRAQQHLIPADPVSFSGRCRSVRTRGGGARSRSSMSSVITARHICTALRDQVDPWAVLVQS